MKIYKVVRLRFPKVKVRTKRSKVLRVNKIIRDLNISKFIYIAAIILVSFFIIKLLISFGGNKESVTNFENTNNVENNILDYYSNNDQHIEKPKKGVNKFLIILKEVIPFFDFSPSKEENEQNVVIDENKEIITYSNLNLLDSFENIKRYMYSIDQTAYVSESDLKLESLLNDYKKVDFSSLEPKVLIFSYTCKWKLYW